jgi:hypothetical protein
MTPARLEIEVTQKPLMDQCGSLSSEGYTVSVFVRMKAVVD